MSYTEEATKFISDAYKNDFVKISEVYNQYVVSPLNAFGLGGFVFDVEGSTTINQKQNITKNYVEDNSVIQDNISVEPRRLRLKRYVGELIYDGAGDSLFERIQNGIKILTLIDGLLPTFTDTVKQLKSIIENGSEADLSDYLNVGTNLWSLVKDLDPTATRQQKAYLYLIALAERKILVSVQTPFEYLTNMGIEDVIAIQDERTKFITDFEIVLQKIRTAETILVQQKYADRSAQQVQQAISKGKVIGNSVDRPDLMWLQFGDLFSS